MKKEKTKLRVIQILCIVSLLITVFSIQTTYARYFEKVDTTYNSKIKKWVIKIDGTKIHQLGKDELTEVMEPAIRENIHMNNNNTLVPGREGYFEFDIDYSTVDVAFRYEFDFEQLNTIPLDDFQIYGYSIVDNGTETITLLDPIGDLDDITQVIDPSVDTDNSGNKKRKIRVLFRWYDGEDNQMDNTEDTGFTGETNPTDVMRGLLNYKVKITFTQTV